jgi:hypothetical protein
VYNEPLSVLALTSIVKDGVGVGVDNEVSTGVLVRADVKTG